MEASEIFKEKVRTEWGNPLGVAQAALDELFRHGDKINLDADDQVTYALQVGVLAGELKNSDPENFIYRFELDVLNEL